MQTSLQETPSRSFLLESSNNKSREKFQSQKSNPFLLASSAPLECRKFFPWCVSFVAFRASCLQSCSPLLRRADRTLFITTLLYSTTLLLLSTNDIPGGKKGIWQPDERQEIWWDSWLSPLSHTAWVVGEKLPWWASLWCSGLGLVSPHAVSFCFLLPEKQSGKGAVLCLPAVSPLLILMTKIQCLHSITWNSMYLNVAFDQNPSDAAAQRTY